MGNGKRSVMVSLTDEEYERIAQLAADDDRSVAAYVRRLIKKALADQEETV